MIGASKILTVSYGTFSCTLEGFDEPFNTMKAIAEYFRDLAAEDRYFGAEPPTPDAAMLHKIAEREIQRRVEAKIQDNGVILRAEESPADGGVTLLPHATRSDLSNTTAPMTLAPVPATPVAAAPIEAPVAPTPEATAVSESVAAKLMRIRSAVAQSRAEAAAPAPLEDATYSEDEHADVPAAEDTIDVIATLAPEHHAAPETDKAPIADDIAAAMADEPLVEAEAIYDADGVLEDAAFVDSDEIVQAAVPAPEPAPVVEASFGHDFALAEDSISALFADEPSSALAEEEVHAAVYAAEDLADDYETSAVADAEDSIAALFADQAEASVAPDQDLLPEQDPEQIDASAQVEDALPEDFAAIDLDVDLVVAAPQTDTVPSNAEDDAILSNLAALAEDEATVAAPVQLETAVDFEVDLDADESDDLAALDAATPTDLAEVELAEEFDLYDDLQDQVESSVSSIFAPEPEDLAEAESEIAADTADLQANVETDLDSEAEIDADQPVLSEKAQRARARVIKIRRIEPAAAPEDASAAVALSAEAEADLMRELADAETETPSPRIVTPSRPVAAEGRGRLDDTTGDAAVSRLIQQTNTEMAGPENRRRLSAIAHLKAAVIATVADRITGGGKRPTDSERIDPYRNDLSRMVRPLPPVPPTPSERVPTLVLVSEQRVDRRIEDETLRSVTAQVGLTGDQPKAFVRPRRVSAASTHAVSAAQVEDEDDGDDDGFDEAAIFTDTKGFIEFADRLGADSLPAMLEAAAAYSACVEGRPHFTRPQLMRQISVATPEVELDRENSLRGFGALLRAGKIAKVRRGQYALTESSHYLTEARKLVS